MLRDSSSEVLARAGREVAADPQETQWTFTRDPRAQVPRKFEESVASLHRSEPPDRQDDERVPFDREARSHVCDLMGARPFVCLGRQSARNDANVPVGDALLVQPRTNDLRRRESDVCSAYELASFVACALGEGA